MLPVPTTIAQGRRFLAALLVPLMLALGGCGGGGEQVASGGIIGTGDAPIVSVGTITALGTGHVTVNEVAFATSGATIRVNGVPATEAALKVGMVVTVQGRLQADGSARATSIDYRPFVLGVVAGVDVTAESFTVLGQIVRTDRLTVFEGGVFSTLVNQYVEVSGYGTAPGEIVATRVVVAASVAPGAVSEVTGAVAALDAAARTFTIGTQLVDFAAIPAPQLPAGLANGVVAKVRGTVPAGSERLLASEVQIESPTVPGAESSRVTIEGYVSDYGSVGHFRVNGQLVDGLAATILGATATALGNGAKVEVIGRLTQGVVVATTIMIEQSAPLTLDGTVEAVNAAASALTVAGQAVAVSAGTQYQDASVAAVRDFGLAVIHVGDRLRVTAAWGASGLVASRIVRVDIAAPPVTQPTSSAEGAISEFVSVGSFKVGGRAVNASSAQFEQGTATDLANGRRVHVDGTLSGEVLLASRVVLLPPDATPPTVVTLAGAITEFASPASFKVAGQQVNAAGATFSGGTAADLADGKRVTVVGMLASGVVTASRVTFEAPPAAPTLEVEGAISGFVSVANFLIAGQATDASTATFSNGSAAQLANGRRVHAKGTVLGGVLKAATVVFEDAEVITNAEVEGRITNFVSAANFQVAGRTINASAATFSGGTAATLANGRSVTVRGSIVGTVLQARSVEFH